MPFFLLPGASECTQLSPVYRHNFATHRTAPAQLGDTDGKLNKSNLFFQGLKFNKAATCADFF